mmetsp:Transcript_11450/g.16047  ORF Transcript_11450/g.16047 Transcript_11450/m.16047 type:complete len:90 (-) Transcript_11450:718-987(-)
MWLHVVRKTADHAEKGSILLALVPESVSTRCLVAHRHLRTIPLSQNQNREGADFLFLKNTGDEAKWQKKGRLLVLDTSSFPFSACDFDC